MGFDYHTFGGVRQLPQTSARIPTRLSNLHDALPEGSSRRRASRLPGIARQSGRRTSYRPRPGRRTPRSASEGPCAAARRGMPGSSLPCASSSRGYRPAVWAQRLLHAQDRPASGRTRRSPVRLQGAAAQDEPRHDVGDAGCVCLAGGAARRDLGGSAPGMPNCSGKVVIPRSSSRPYQSTMACTAARSSPQAKRDPMMRSAHGGPMGFVLLARMSSPFFTTEMAAFRSSSPPTPRRSTRALP